jgi:hypothetical protein
MNKDTHVYCTNCIRGAILIESIKNNAEPPLECIHCDSHDSEDSKPYNDRPHYTPILKYKLAPCRYHECSSKEDCERYIDDFEFYNEMYVNFSYYYDSEAGRCGYIQIKRTKPINNLDNMEDDNNGTSSSNTSNS